MSSMNPASKVKYERFVAERAGIPQENIDEFLMDTPQMLLQSLENEALKQNVFVPIDVNDDHEQHLIAMGANVSTPAGEAHRLAHIMEIVKQPAQLPQNGLNENSMMNSMASQGMSQAQSQLTP